MEMPESMGATPEKSSDTRQQVATSSTRGFSNQYHAFTSMAMPYFYEQWKARVLFAVMLFLTLLNSGVRVVFSYLVRDFWSALSEERVDDFWSILRRFLVAMMILAPINVLYRYQRQMLAIHWREWMTERVLQLYFSNRVYYGLERSHGTQSGSTNNDEGPVVVDNPDQRITEDVRSFTEFSLTLFLTVLMSVVDLICFSIILYTIMPELFVAIAVFASFGTLMTMLIGKVLVKLNFEKLQKEANFRYNLVRVRDNAEAIAFLKGEPVERASVRRKLAHVIANMHSLNSAIRNLDFFTSYYYYLTWILPILVVAPEYFKGEFELGVINQAVSSFSHVLDDLSLLVNQWESLTEFGAGIDRLYTFLTVAQQLADPGHPQETSPLLMTASKLPTEETQSASPRIHLQQLPQNSPSILTMENITLETPNQRMLICNLSLAVPKGQNLLICGASGSGKSSLLRAIAGLWNNGAGSIYAPSKDEVYFLPQKAYCSMGSLRDQLLYPDIASSDPRNLSDSAAPRLSDSELLNILEAVDLAELPHRAGHGNAIQGLDQIMDWSNILSLGEQQRLAFGRILVHRPKYVIMDESTSAMDMASEQRMYELLRRTAASEGEAISYISVGHRPSLVAFHQMKLTLQAGSYVIEPIHQTHAVQSGA